MVVGLLVVFNWLLVVSGSCDGESCADSSSLSSASLLQSTILRHSAPVKEPTAQTTFKSSNVLNALQRVFASQALPEESHRLVQLQDKVATARTSPDESEKKEKGQVNQLFTFGGPATMTFAPENPKDEKNQCFPGIRFFRSQDEDGYRWQDISAEFDGMFHPKMNLVTLGAEVDDSQFYGCPDTDASTFPRRSDGWPSVEYHSGTQIISHYRKVYEEVEKQNTLPGLKEEHREEVLTMMKLGLSAGGLSDDSISWIPPGSSFEKGFKSLKKDIGSGGHTDQVKHLGLGDEWRLVGAKMIKDPNFKSDFDWVVLVQHNESKQCLMSFDSADLIYPFTEQRLGLQVTPTDFCGCEKCAHTGFRQELLATIESDEFQKDIKPKLSNCETVGVTGYSLGAATADLYTYCVNSGSGPDHDMAAWEKGDVKLMDAL